MLSLYTPTLVNPFTDERQWSTSLTGVSLRDWGLWFLQAFGNWYVCLLFSMLADDQYSMVHL